MDKNKGLPQTENLPKKEDSRQVSILGVRVDMGLTCNKVLEIISDQILNKRIGSYICTTNPEFIIEAQKDENFKKLINESVLSLPDGVGLILAEEFLRKIRSLTKDWLFPVRALGLWLSLTWESLCGGYYAKRVTGVDLVKKILEVSSEKRWTVFLLGGWPKSIFGQRIHLNEDYSHYVRDAVTKLYPDANVIGASSEYSYQEENDIDNLNTIKKAMYDNNVDSIDILLVAYGQNKQENWIKRNSSQVPAYISIGVGGTFDYLTGYSKQVPTILKKIGLEWLFRLITQPYRLYRIVNAVIMFPIKIFINTIKEK